MERPALEVADLFGLHGAAYRQAHNCSVHEQKVMRAIERCRTAALGGHVDACDACGSMQISYNSCRNRSCPKCQGRARQQWICAREAELLPIEYFPVVFTLPHALNGLVRQNRALLLDLLFCAASQTLLEFGRRHLEGEIGIVAVLHTWGQTLCEHNHVHGILTGGALQLPSGESGAEGTPQMQSRWRSCRRGFLFPVRALAEVFRGKYVAGLRRACGRGELRLGGELAQLAEAAEWRRFVGGLYGERWIVYAKRPFAGPREVVRYLGRYTHRGPIANARLRSLQEGRVRFAWKDYREAGRWKEMELGAEEFLRRYLLHVLPPRFVRIRHYGLYSRAKRRRHLAAAHALLRAQGVPPAEGAEPQQASGSEEGAEPGQASGERCAACGKGHLVRQREWHAGERPPVLVQAGERWAA